MPPPDWDAIARYLAGESTGDEAAAIARWLEAHPADRELIAGLDAAAVFEPAEVDVESALARAHARIAAATPDATPAAPSLPFTARRRRRPVLVAVAATLLAASVVAIVVARRSPKPNEGIATAPTAYASAVGERDSLRLADGSRVLLGPDSRLIVPADFGSGSRQVELHGDAYFEVHHDAAQPFIVRVGAAVVQDVGTTFAVETDDGDTTRVAVVSGSVRLRAASEPAAAGVVLEEGDRGSIDPVGHATVVRHGIRDADTAWTTGQLVFRDASVTRLAAEIRRWYGVQLRVTDSSLLDKHVTMSFNHEPVDRVLKIIGATLGARVERHGDTATLSQNRGSTITR